MPPSALNSAFLQSLPDCCTMQQCCSELHRTCQLALSACYVWPAASVRNRVGIETAKVPVIIVMRILRPQVLRIRQLLHRRHDVKSPS